MKKEEIVDSVLQLAELEKDLISTKKDLTDLKQQKAQFQNDIALLKKQQLEEKDKFTKIIIEGNKEINELNNKIANIRAVRDSLSSSAVPELRKLETEKETVRMALAELSVKTAKYNNDVALFSKRQTELNPKLDIIKQITELAKGL